MISFVFTVSYEEFGRSLLLDDISSRISIRHIPKLSLCCEKRRWNECMKRFAELSAVDVLLIVCRCIFCRSLHAQSLFLLDAHAQTHIYSLTNTHAHICKDMQTCTHTNTHTHWITLNNFDHNFNTTCNINNIVLRTHKLTQTNCPKSRPGYRCQRVCERVCMRLRTRWVIRLLRFCAWFRRCHSLSYVKTGQGALGVRNLHSFCAHALTRARTHKLTHMHPRTQPQMHSHTLKLNHKHLHSMIHKHSLTYTHSKHNTHTHTHKTQLTHTRTTTTTNFLFISVSSNTHSKHTFLPPSLKQVHCFRYW